MHAYARTLQVRALRTSNARLAAAVREREEENAHVKQQLLELEQNVNVREVRGCCATTA